ncbi:dephospho-CoA kinase [Crocosphaera chwakensis]|uniref:Dephospho-CoA kinase n=1 Tax=Crocosphaera chwakensis CCY0110 TaxID=391612 RepID=A3IVT7_9CHRO|nr:dephospho-CoA kinase [Crocosphaera chwakensis]EAZ89398.1 Dephospho-CoA kinase [Crocosphaera chwakensis CCY0110]
MNRKSKRIIGLTGGIGTGKTTVSHYLATVCNIRVLDADTYAREAVEKNSPILQTIKKRYGSDICLNNGELNRKKLGNIIFNNSTEKQWLEQQIHPYVRQRFQQEKNQYEGEIIVLDIPLLFESQLTDLVTEIWVVYCSYEQQLQRLIDRNYLSEEEAIARIKSQFPIEDKVSRADVVLDNSSTKKNLYQQIDKIIKKN